MEELLMKKTKEVYEYYESEVAEKMYKLFRSREDHGIRRIHEMIGFFESDSCISIKLAEYFGENLEKENCGHCSFCKSGKVTMEKSTELKSLSNFDFREIADDFIRAMGEHFSPLNMTKFLCGINTPVFGKLRIKKLPSFGLFEKYPFADVKNWIYKNGI